MAAALFPSGAACSVEVTKPVSLPSAHCVWLALQLWQGTPSSCTVELAW
jgi:hypothetical protein